MFLCRLHFHFYPRRRPTIINLGAVREIPKLTSVALRDIFEGPIFSERFIFKSPSVNSKESYLKLLLFRHTFQSHISWDSNWFQELDSSIVRQVPKITQRILNSQ